MVWAIILCVRSVALPDSILVSSDPGSDPTRDESQKNRDIYFRDPVFLRGSASFCVSSWTPNNDVWEQKFNDRMYSASRTAKQHRSKQLLPEDPGVEARGRDRAHSSLQADSPTHGARREKGPGRNSGLPIYSHPNKNWTVCSNNYMGWGAKLFLIP